MTTEQDIEELHVGDVGTRLIVTLVDNQEQPVDLSQSTLKQYILKKPDRSISILSALFVTDGSDGQLQFITTATTLTIAGYYKLQVYIEEDANKWHTDKVTFRVWPNLDE